MQDLGFEGLLVLLILLPGFVAARIKQALAEHPKQSELDKIVEALIYAFLVYVGYALTGQSLPLDIKVIYETAAEKHYSVTLHPGLMLLETGIAVALALLLSANENNDITGRMLRALKITDRTTRSSVWADTLTTYRGYVQVEMADGRRVTGWLKRFSERPDQGMLYLMKAHWVLGGGKRADITGDGILFTKNSGIKHVMLLNKTAAPQPPRPRTTAAAAGNQP